MLKTKKHRGFTLIELLVVIAIIGILASIVLVSLGGARAKARDARRQSDIRQFSLAMEMFYDDNEYAYMTTTGDTAIPASTTGRIEQKSISSYLDPIPLDPGGGDEVNCNDVLNAGYRTISNIGSISINYCVFACLESAQDTADIFIATPKGTRAIADIPTDMASCSF